MYNAVFAPYSDSGTLYYVIFNSDLQVYNGDTFVDKDDADWAMYAQPCTLPQASSDGGRGFSAPISAVGCITLMAYEQVGKYSPVERSLCTRRGNELDRQLGGQVPLRMIHNFVISFGDADGITIIAGEKGGFGHMTTVIFGGVLAMTQTGSIIGGVR
jgi:hypothetical protein